MVLIAVPWKHAPGQGCRGSATSGSSCDPIVTRIKEEQQFQVRQWIVRNPGLDPQSAIWQCPG